MNKYEIYKYLKGKDPSWVICDKVFECRYMGEFGRCKPHLKYYLCDNMYECRRVGSCKCERIGILLYKYMYEYGGQPQYTNEDLSSYYIVPGFILFHTSFGEVQYCPLKGDIKGEIIRVVERRTGKYMYVSTKDCKPAEMQIRELSMDGGGYK